jgi:hypothetical protein
MGSPQPGVPMRSLSIDGATLISARGSDPQSHFCPSYSLTKIRSPPRTCLSLAVTGDRHVRAGQVAGHDVGHAPVLRGLSSPAIRSTAARMTDTAAAAWVSARRE